MKIYSFIIVIFISLLSSSCSNWLDVQPLGDIDANDQIKSGEGFMEILDGAYIGIAKGDLYGKELTYGYLDELATNHYTTEIDKLYNYTDQSKYGRSDKVFLKAYEVIANLNFLLDNIDEKKDLFNEADFLGIKAEAKAIRAFVHFDLLRAFAANYEDAPEEKAIPYVDVFEKRLFLHNTAKEVVDKILLDLNEAEENLELVDPIIGLDFENGGDILSYRKYRFNYYAILAIKARLYQYIGEKQMATQYAQRVIDEFPYQWNLSGAKDVLENQSFSSENILLLDAYNLYSSASGDFGGGRYTTGNEFNEYGKSKIFDADDNGTGVTDIRYTYCFTYDVNGKKNISTKFNNTYITGMPLIRITEMMLLVAENKIGTDNDGAITIINEIKNRRLVQALSTVASEEEIMQAVVKEFRKETFLEGQFFYLNKRLRSTSMPALDNSDLSVEQEVFTLPLPQNEIEFGDGSRI